MTDRDHADLTDEELVARLRDHRKGTNEWAAALGELQRRGDRLHSEAQFRAALARADDDPPHEPAR
jgi:hypothetical protein